MTAARLALYIRANSGMAGCSAKKELSIVGACGPSGLSAIEPSGKGPPRDDARQCRHVVLQLHDFAREIFVQAALAVLSGAGIRPQRLLIVEKDQHRRML